MNPPISFLLLISGSISRISLSLLGFAQFVSGINTDLWRARLGSVHSGFVSIDFMPLFFLFSLVHVGVTGVNLTSGYRQRYLRQRIQSNCPLDKLEDCFHRVFSSMSDPKFQAANCDDYEHISACFYYANCSEKESSAVGAKVFFSMKGVKVPKEFFIALRSRWGLRCSLECAQYDVKECRSSMLLSERDTDKALLKEMQSMKTQMASMAGKKSIKNTCANYRRTLLRWHHFRLDKCSFGDSSCYCRSEEKVLRSLCAVNCDKLQFARGNGPRRAMTGCAIVYALSFHVFAFVYH